MNKRKTLRAGVVLRVAATLFCVAARAPAHAQSSLDDFTVTLRPPASDVAVVLKPPTQGGGPVTPGGGGGTPPTPTPTAAELPGVGGGVDAVAANGGQEIRVIDGRPRVQPEGARSDWSSNAQIETWGSGGRRGVSGTRASTLIGYTRGLSPTSEVAITVPMHAVSLGGGYGDNSGIGDTEVAYRYVFCDPEAPDGPTVTLSGRLYLPTGSYRQGTGLGKLGFGPSLAVAKPVGRATLAYGGLGYTAVGQPSGASPRNVVCVWLGGFTALAPRWSVQYEAVRFNSPSEEQYLRALVGVRYALTPTRGLQINLKQELQADGKPTAVTLGYSARM